MLEPDYLGKGIVSAQLRAGRAATHHVAVVESVEVHHINFGAFIKVTVFVSHTWPTGPPYSENVASSTIVIVITPCRVVSSPGAVVACLPKLTNETGRANGCAVVLDLVDAGIW